MATLLALILVYFIVLPMACGAFAFQVGALRSRIGRGGKALAGWHPLNPYYKLSPYHFGK